MAITGGNEVTFSGAFTAVDGSGAVPTNAAAWVTYTNLSGLQATDQVTLALGVDGIWRGAWDSSVATQGQVSWVVKCWGGLKGAREGQFFLEANAANLASP